MPTEVATEETEMPADGDWEPDNNETTGSESPDYSEAESTSDDFNVINGNTAIIMTEGDLYTAINSSTITTIYLGADIILTSDVAVRYTINPDKLFLTIDGLNPYAEDEKERDIIHTLTDKNSSSGDLLLRLRTSGNLKMITLQNLKLIGRNHYGIVAVTTPGVTLNYQNIIYSGPQLTYNPDGYAYYENCHITIEKNGVSETGEVAEAADITLAGDIFINKPGGGGDEVFYLRASNTTTASLRILAGANVDITHDQSSSGGLIYSDQTSYPVIIGEGAILRFQGYQFVIENFAPGIFVLEEGAQVYISLRTSGDRPGLYTNQLKVGKDAVFHMEAGVSSNSFPLIEIRNGGSAVFSEPLSVVLKMAGTSPASYLLQGAGSQPQLEIDCEQINYWSSNDGGGLTALPEYHWQKKAGNLTLTANLTTSGTYTNLVTNYKLPEDQITPSWLSAGDLTSSTMAGNRARILSLGRLPLDANYTARPASGIAGNTAGFGIVQAKLPEAEQALWGPAAAEEEGAFLLALPADWQEGALVMVLANKDYLYQQALVTTIQQGFSLTYDGNGQTEGEAPLDSPLYSPGTYAWIAGHNGLLKAGYDFIGWSRSPDGLEGILVEGDKLLMDGNIILYAVWQEKTTSFAFVKVDETNYSSHLAGAVFQLYRCRHVHDGVCSGLTNPALCTHIHQELAADGIEGCWELWQQEVSRGDGRVIFSNLSSGVYQLKEIETLAGYELPLGQWRLTIDLSGGREPEIMAVGAVMPPGFLVDSQQAGLLLPNERQLSLPLTGGDGGQEQMLIAGGFLSAAVFLWWIKKKI